MENLSSEIGKKLYKVERYDFVNLGGVLLHTEVETLEKAKELALYEFMNLSNKQKKNFEILVIENEENEETVVPEYMRIPFVLNAEEIEKKVNKIYEHIIDIMSNYKNSDGNKYNNVDLEINDYVKSKFEDEDKIIQDIIFWDTKYLIKRDELEELEDIQRELEEELLYKEVTLLELDNTVQQIMTTRSAFDDCGTNELLKSTCISYYYSDNYDIDIDFEIIEKNEEELDETTIKITNVSVN